MRLPIACSTLFFAAAVAVMATPMPLQPFDPEILEADPAGPATPITTNGINITLSPTGGGIFVFNNASGGPFSKLDLKILFPFSPFPQGFGVDSTIVVPPSLVGQQSTFKAFQFSGVLCDLTTRSDTNSCLEMVLGLVPGPLVGTGQNFILDFDAKDPETGLYTGVDAQVLNGTYTGGTDTSSARGGDWPDNATGFTVPTLATPEPSYFGALLLCGAGLAFYYRRRRQVR
jgi:hypothetical protein